MSEPLALATWSRGVASRAAALRADAAAAPANGRLPLETGHRFHRGVLRVPAAGTAVLRLACPRPLRLWVEGELVVDEPLSWRSFQRRLDLAVVTTLPAGDVEVLAEVAPRPRHWPGIDQNCPSRNREAVMAALARRFPEELALAGEFHPGVSLPPLSLRFGPGQFHRDGVTWQELQLRTWPDHRQPPSTDLRVAADGEPARLLIEAADWPGQVHDGSGDEERRQGVRRLFVPIGRSFARPPLRQAGADPRPEPELEPTHQVQLRVEGPLGAVAIGMPAYESLGRLAPRVEHRPLRWPGEDELLATVPMPTLPAKWSAYGDLYRAAWRMILKLLRHPRPESGLPNDYLATAVGGFAHHVFVWDSSFTAMATAYGWRALPHTATLDMLYSRQMDGGYLHREHDIRDGLPAPFEPDFSPNPPVMAVAELGICRLTGDLGRLRRVYPALAEHHRWLAANRRLDDGTFWTTGLANGLDNSPSLGDGYPDLTAQMAHHAECLAQMAEVLGLDAEARSWREARDAIGRACNARLWSDEMGLYSTSLSGGGHNPNKVVTGFWPLWAGIVPPERVERLARQLKDPATFWRHHPAPSLAADAPDFHPGGDYWLGSTWAPTNCMVAKGFQRAGRLDLAREFVHRHLTVMSEVLAATGRIWENYCSEKSERGNISCHDYSWSAVGPIALLMEVVLGLEPDAPARRLRWTPPVGEECGVDRYPLGPCTISLRQKPDGAIEVETDLPFTLVLVGAGGEKVHACAGGRQSFKA